MKGFMIALSLFCIISSGWTQKLLIDVKAGKNYYYEKKMLFFKLPIEPQMAIWLDDAKGNFVTNIFITGKSAKSSWFGGDKVRRPDSLPVWSHQMGKLYSDGLTMPDKKNPLPDATTGATEKSSFQKIWNIPPAFSKGRYSLYLEVNNSFDYNATFKEKLAKTNPLYSGVNGQPSIVYQADVDLNARSDKPVKMKAIGHGEVQGKNGSIDTNLSGVQEALQILDSITITIEK